MQLCAITCGDDKAIKVWNATTGSKLYTFEGHDTPVHSVCPHNKQNVNFFFSTSVNGKIKAWLYNNMGYQVDYDASDHSITMMAYGADGKRLFSCGTSKDGESHVVEWNENDGVIKRNYVGFQKPSSGVVQFDTSKNKYLSVGDDYAIKVWDVDKVNILTAVDAEGGLPLPDTTIYLTESKWDSSLDDLKDTFPKTYIKDGIIPADKKSKYLDSELVIESCLEPLLVHF
ncbi:hypothetical protein FF1_030939 [Malus domestica]